MNSPSLSPTGARLLADIENRRARIGVIGLGYVGLPTLIAFRGAGFPVLGFDIDAAKVTEINAGRSYIHHIPADKVARLRDDGPEVATSDFRRLAEVDAVILCVPTPLTRHREPDLRYVINTTEEVARYQRSGQLVVLESTTYPGTTEEVMRPALERGRLRVGTDIFLAFSPEREDPGNPVHTAASIPKIVGADDPNSLTLARALYTGVAPRIVVVRTSATAEAVKLTENIFRSVNIALVNELKLLFERMGIDVWEVIDAAKTKPFGYMPFYPGPGLGGHCVPIDPFYLTWKARQFDFATRLIELAGEINTAMPRHVVTRLAEALNQHSGRGLKGARILLLGIAYKKNVDDTRESPALRIIELLRAFGAQTEYHDPLVPEIGQMRDHPELTGMRSVPWDAVAFANYDAAFICTDHDGVNYSELVACCPLVIDSRNATQSVTQHRHRIVKV